MSEATCASCRWFEPGHTYPDFRRRGICGRITVSPGSDRPARIIGGHTSTCVQVSAHEFGCALHEHTPKPKDTPNDRE